MKAYCDKCAIDRNYNPYCTGACKPPFGVRLRVKAIKVPVWINGILRTSLHPDHPESRENWIRRNLGIEPEPWMLHPNIGDLMDWAKDYVTKMKPSDREKMFRTQAEGWARSEAQWAKDFKEGKCERD